MTIEQNGYVRSRDFFFHPAFGIGGYVYREAAVADADAANWRSRARDFAAPAGKSERERYISTDSIGPPRAN